MMKTTVSPRDIEMISAYLDGQLGERQRARLEARLNKEPELNQLLEDLHRTKMMLSSAPKLKAPRSFKLKPEMVEVKTTRPIFPVFQFASLAAAVLLLVVLVGDYMGFGRQALAPMPVAESMPEVMEAPAEQQRNFAEAPTEEPGAMALQAPSLESMPTGTPEGLLKTAQTPSVTLEAPLEESGVASDTIMLDATEPAVGMLAAPEAEERQPVEEEPAAVVPAVNELRILEIVLAVFAVGFGLFSLVLRRRARR